MRNNPVTRVSTGFTLIELMIVVAIVAILAAVALPAYSDYITRSRIAEATSGLAAKRASVEQFYDNYRYYRDTSKTPQQAPACDSDTSTSASFTFSCDSTLTNADAYTLQAVGRGSMNGFTFTINQANTRATTSVPTGWTTNANCWITRKGGIC